MSNIFRIFCFKEQVIFDDYNYQTWFCGNDLVENLCTYVPFITCNFDEIEFDKSNRTHIEESNKKSLEDEKKLFFNVPPSKKKCSGNKKIIFFGTNKY